MPFPLPTPPHIMYTVAISDIGGVGIRMVDDIALAISSQ